MFSNLTLANEIDDIVEIAPDWYGSHGLAHFSKRKWLVLSL